MDTHGSSRYTTSSSVVVPLVTGSDTNVVIGIVVGIVVSSVVDVIVGGSVLKSEVFSNSNVLLLVVGYAVPSFLQQQSHVG